MQLRSRRFDALFKEHLRPGMTATGLLAKLSVEGRLPYDSRLTNFRKLRMDVRLRYIESYLRDVR